MSLVAYSQGSKATLTKGAADCFAHISTFLSGFARLGLRQPAAAFHSIACCGILLLCLPQILSAKSYTYDPIERFNANSFKELTHDDSWTKMDLRRAGLVDKDMVHLANLKNLEELWLDSHRITSAGYQVLSKLPKLRILGVHSTSGKETQEVLGIIKDLQLEELDLRNCRDFTGKGLDQLNHKTTLRKLNLSCFRGTLNDQGLESLKEFTGLTHLDLSQHNGIRNAIQHIGAMSELQSLNLYGCVGIQDKAATQAFAKLTKLKHLNMGFCWAHKGNGLIFPPALTDLYLVESKSLTDAAFQELPCKDTLVNANLYQCLPLTDMGVAAFSHLPHLQKFNVGSIRALTNQSLQTIGTNKALTHLTICDNDNFDDKGLSYLAGLTNLQVLNLWHTQGLTGEGFQHLSKMPKLKELNLADCHHLQDPHFADLAKLSSLQNLYLDNSPISDKAIAHLQPLQLSELTLSGCENLTDTALSTLAHFQTLQYLDISNCIGFSDIGLLTISQALPDCEIVK